MKLVDEEEDFSLALAHLVEDGLQPLLKLAPVLGPGDEAAHIQGEDGLVPQAVRDIPPDDPLGQALGDGGLAHARLADQAGVVLLAAVQNLHHALDLLLPANNGVQLALPGTLAQIDAVVIQKFALFLRLAAGPLLSSTAVLGRLLLGRRIAAVVEQAVQKWERSGLAAFLIIFLALVHRRIQLLRAAEGLHHLTVDVLQVLRRDTHTLHHVLHLGQTQLGGT